MKSKPKEQPDSQKAPDALDDAGDYHWAVKERGTTRTIEAAYNAFRDANLEPVPEPVSPYAAHPNFGRF